MENHIYYVGDTTPEEADASSHTIQETVPTVKRTLRSSRSPKSSSKKAPVSKRTSKVKPAPKTRKSLDRSAKKNPIYYGSETNSDDEGDNADDNNRAISNATDQRTKKSIKLNATAITKKSTKDADISKTSTIILEPLSEVLSIEAEKSGNDTIKKYHASDNDDEGEASTSSATDSSMKESTCGYDNNPKENDGGIKFPESSYVACYSAQSEKHFSRIHARDVSYSCKICDFTCECNKKYYSHMRIHFEGPPYNCETCEYRCNHIHSLLSHHLTHTREKPFECDRCGRGCVTEADLHNHMRRHIPRKPYQCEDCGRKFLTEADLVEHIPSHSEYKILFCDVCDFQTKCGKELSSHERIHAGKLLRCRFPNCKFSTLNMDRLKHHHYIHTSEPSHTCSVCGKVFSTRRHLEKHKRLTHSNDDEKPYMCDLCNYCTLRKDRLKVHFQKHHETSVAKPPFKPKNQRQHNYEFKIYSPQTRNLHNKTEKQFQRQPAQHSQSQTAAIDPFPIAPAPNIELVTEMSRQEIHHTLASVALRELGSAAHNYQVAFIEQSHHPDVIADLYVGPLPPSDVPVVIAGQRITANDGASAVLISHFQNSADLF